MSGRLNPKHGRFKAGDTSISAKALNDMQDAIVRQFVGGDQTEVEYYGDRVVIRSKDSGPRNADISDVVTRFVVLEVLDDMLKCAPYRQQYTGSDTSAIWVASTYDAALGIGSPEIIYIAKPQWFQPSFWNGKTINAIAYVRTGIDARTASHSGSTPVAERITPSYAVGDIIHAVMGITGLTAPDGNNVGWTDMNFAGRMWGGNPAPGGSTSHVGTTDDYDNASTINLGGTTVNVTDDSFWNVAEGKFWQVNLAANSQFIFAGLGIVVFNTPVVICAEEYYCAHDFEVEPDQQIDDWEIPLDDDGRGVTVIRITGDGPWAITGMEASEGRVIHILNTTNDQGYLIHDSIASSVGNKFAMPGLKDFPINGGGAARLRKGPVYWELMSDAEGIGEPDQVLCTDATGTGREWRTLVAGDGIDLDTSTPGEIAISLEASDAVDCCTPITTACCPSVPQRLYLTISDLEDGFLDGGFGTNPSFTSMSPMNGTTCTLTYRTSPAFAGPPYASSTYWYGTSDSPVGGANFNEFWFFCYNAGDGNKWYLAWRVAGLPNGNFAEVADTCEPFLWQNTIGFGAAANVGATATIGPQPPTVYSPVLERHADEAASGTIDGVNDVFTLLHSPKPGTLRVYKNGLLQRGSGNDYTLSGTTITFVAGAIPSGADSITVTYSY
jgi:hypothetical protein